MLARIEDDRDVDAVVVHKIERLARNMEDHVAIRAALRRRDVALVWAPTTLEETASGRLVERIHALMAELYSSNLSSEIRKGMTQKAKMGGWPHQAPLGYTNVRESIGGRQVAHIVPPRPPTGPPRRTTFSAGWPGVSCGGAYIGAGAQGTATTCAGRSKQGATTPAAHPLNGQVSYAARRDR